MGETQVKLIPVNAGLFSPLLICRLLEVVQSEERLFERELGYRRIMFELRIMQSCSLTIKAGNNRRFQQWMKSCWFDSCSCCRGTLEQTVSSVCQLTNKEADRKVNVHQITN